VARVLRMPGVASDGEQGVLSSWLIDETDSFDAAQTIAYVETSTLLLSVESGRPGVLLKTLVEPGTQVDVGMPIGVVGDRDERVSDLDALLVELGVDGCSEVDPPPAPVAPLAPELPEPELPEPELPEPELTPPGAPVVPEPEVSATEPGSEPTQAPAMEQAPTPAPAPPTAPRLTHDHLRTTIRADRLARAGGADAIEHLIVRAVAAAHRVLPELNLTRGPHGVRREETVDIGLAIGTPDGLVVPVLRDVGSLSLHDIALLVGDVTAEAKAGRLHLADRGGSVAVSYLGRYGLDESVPSVAAPQVAALAVGAMRDEPVLVAGAVVAGRAMTLTLTVDHDLVEDSLAARWLGLLAALLERPEWMND
jgi:pyruvate dehydrogenase E2 component (dihydrolipoamide acetyltransferase)